MDTVKKNTGYIFWITGLILFLAAVWWPGDAPWINDEPVLISNALAANHNGKLAGHGLQGSFGATYGPVPTWIYQVLLGFTHDLVLISLLKNSLSFIILFVCLFLISKKLGIIRQPILLIFVSPYICFYGRILWDNCFLIPVSALLILFFILFSFKRSICYFFILVFLSIILIHIHLMAVLLICPFAAMMLVFEWRWFKNHPFSVLAGIVAFSLSCLPYIMTAASHIHQEGQFKASVAASIFNSLAGAKFFSFIGFADYFLPEIYSPEFMLPFPVTFILCIVSGFSYVFFLVGIIGTVNTVKRLFKRGAKLSKYSALDKLSISCGVCIAVNLIFFAVTRHMHHPHYFNAVWLPYFFFLWQGTGIILSHEKAAYSYRIYFAGMAAMFICTLFFIHTNGGNRMPYYGATLANQIKVAKRIAGFSPGSRLIINVRNYLLFPHGLNTLLKLYTPINLEMGKSRSEGLLEIIYRDPDWAHTGWIEMRKVPDISGCGTQNSKADPEDRVFNVKIK